MKKINEVSTLLGESPHRSMSLKISVSCQEITKLWEKQDILQAKCAIQGNKLDTLQAYMGSFTMVIFFTFVTNTKDSTKNPSPMNSDSITCSLSLWIFKTSQQSLKMSAEHRNILLMTRLTKKITLKILLYFQNLEVIHINTQCHIRLGNVIQFLSALNLANLCHMDNQTQKYMPVKIEICLQRHQ